MVQAGLNPFQAAKAEAAELGVSIPTGFTGSVSSHYNVPSATSSPSSSGGTSSLTSPTSIATTNYVNTAIVNTAATDKAKIIASPTPFFDVTARDIQSYITKNPSKVLLAAVQKPAIDFFTNVPNPLNPLSWFKLPIKTGLWGLDKTTETLAPSLKDEGKEVTDFVRDAFDKPADVYNIYYDYGEKGMSETQSIVKENVTNISTFIKETTTFIQDPLKPAKDEFNKYAPLLILGALILGGD